MVRNVLIVLIALCAPLQVAPRAQSRRAGDGFVAVRAGANLVGNTYRFRARRPEPGAGGSVGTFLSPGWALEFETWVRRSNPECCGARHREALYSLSVMRLLTAGGLQPYMVGGLTWLQATSRQMQVQVGVGAQFPLRPRLAMAIDLRGNGGGSTMIVRPTAALIYHFR
ncbi:MAG: hypothetical protein EHM55_11285 [Acidobacteria bacterium]|nr:MAG: hypothetical protein EHM55_11285 [Acidobacteriota bacterium]